MGTPYILHAFLLGDNQSVLENTIVSASQLKTKFNSIPYNFVREGSARDSWRTLYINTHENPTDLMAKPPPSGKKRSAFIYTILWWL